MGKCLSLSLADLNLLELRILSGKCYICRAESSSSSSNSNGTKYITDLIEHLRGQHDLTIRSAYSRCVCLCCGSQQADVEKLVRHVYDVHKILLFASVNKICYITNQRNKSENNSSSATDLVSSAQKQPSATNSCKSSPDKNATRSMVASKQQASTSKTSESLLSTTPQKIPKGISTL